MFTSILAFALIGLVGVLMLRLTQDRPTYR